MRALLRVAQSALVATPMIVTLPLIHTVPATGAAPEVPDREKPDAARCRATLVRLRAALADEEREKTEAEEGSRRTLGITLSAALWATACKDVLTSAEIAQIWPGLEDKDTPPKPSRP
jgi:hypothetical protein